MVFSGRFFGRCLTSGHLESLGQLWLSVFNSGAGGYSRVMTRSRHLSEEVSVGRQPTVVCKHAIPSRHAASTGSAPIAAGPGHPMRSRGGSITCSIQGAELPSAKAAHCLEAYAIRPLSRASVLRRRSIYRERLAPTGNRAIPDDRTSSTDQRNDPRKPTRCRLIHPRA